MKSIFNIALLLTLVMTLFSCSTTYIYSTLNATNRETKKTNNGDFFYENDSLWMSYNFKGEHAPIIITVFNKLDEPLFIDWNQSILIYNGIKHTYKRGEVIFKGDQYGEPYANTNIMDKEQVDNMLKTPRNISYIPPQTMVSHRTFDLTLDLSRYRKARLDDIVLKDKEGKKSNMKGLIFDYAGSPLQFSSYINTYYNDPNSEQTYATDFYMANVIKTNKKPQKMPEDMSGRGDMLYYKRKPSYKFWKKLGKGAATSALIITEAAIETYLYRDE